MFLERALEALRHLPDTAANADRGIDIRLGLRVALLAGGDLIQVRVHLEQAEAQARALDDRRRLMPIIISRSTILVNLGALDQAIEAGLQGRSLAEQADDTSGYVSACYALGQAYWNRGDFELAVSVLSSGIDRAASAPQRQFAGTTGSVPVLCRVSLSHTYAFMGEMERACASAREALEIARETARPYDLSYAHAAQGLADLTLGNLADAARHLEEALHFSEAGEVKLLFPHAARYLGRAYALAGRLDEARVLLERAVEYAAQRALVALHGWCAASLGFTHLLSGELAAARSIASTAWDLADRHAYAPLRAQAARLMGAIIGRQEFEAAAGEAEEWFRKGAAIAREIGMQPEVAHCHRELAELLARTGRPAEARSALAVAVRAFQSASMPFYASLAQQELAALPQTPNSGPAARSPSHVRLASDS
jgi:tetratricopeptide (TPR) repeat protein